MAQAKAKQSSTGQIDVTKATMAQPYLGVVPMVIGSGNQPNAIAMAHLTPTPTSTAYLCGMIVSGAGATAAKMVVITVEGLLGGTRNLLYGFCGDPQTSNTPLALNFNPPLPASGPGIQILITVPAGGAGNLYSGVMAYGYAAIAAPTPDI